MANQKITDLTALTTPANDDVLVIVDDTGGTPTSKKITLANLLGRAYGEIYVTGGSGSQTLAAATWTKLTQFTANGSSLNTSPDHTNDHITADATGFYLAMFQASFDSNTAADETDFRVYWNSVAQTHITATVLASSSTRTHVSGLGIVDVTSTATDFELYANITTGGGNVDLTEAQFVVLKLGET